MKLLSRFIFWITGWKVISNVPPEVKRCVMVAAPHTSNWDFLYARCAFYIMGIKLRFLIKDDYFFFPLGYIMSAMGGVPVDRSKAKGKKVAYMIELFEKHDELVMLIPPEGTRKYVPEWRKGFYYVAKGAGVPIALGFLDYKKKFAGIGPIFYPGDDIDADMKEILDFFRNITPKYPEQGVR